MITMSQTKSANFLFIVAVLKSMRDGAIITPAEYERAKRYYQKLTGSDLVIADYLLLRHRLNWSPLNATVC